MASLISQTTSFVDVCPEWALVEHPGTVPQPGDSPLAIAEHARDIAEQEEVSPRFKTKLGAALQLGTIMRTDLQPAPLNSNWIIKGNPTARSLPLGEAPDGNLTFGLWDCTEGEFVFKYRSDEIVHILEGEAIVRGPGMELHLRPGVVAFFPKGSTLHWTVHHPIKKLWIFRSTEQSLFNRLASKLKRIWQKMTPATWRKQGETPAHFNISNSDLSQPGLSPQE